MSAMAFAREERKVRASASRLQSRNWGRRCRRAGRFPSHPQHC